jgi:hypothetical protein
MGRRKAAGFHLPEPDPKTSAGRLEGGFAAGQPPAYDFKLEVRFLHALKSPKRRAGGGGPNLNMKN